MYKRQHEHGPREDGVMHDQQLIAELFSNTIKAARILGKDAAWATVLYCRIPSAFYDLKTV